MNVKTILVITGVIIIFFISYIWLNSKPINMKYAKSLISKLLQNEVIKNNRVSQGLLLIDSKEKDFFYSGAFDKDGSIDINTQFHTASIGKAFTATLLAILVDDGKIELNDKISKFLNPELLSGLFKYGDKDYKDEVTITHLLSHTSGIADYFEDKTVNSPPMSELVITDKNHLWTPEELIDFSRKYQSAVSLPGDKYHYSDTGFILLGLIVEKVTGNKFHEELHSRIFEPLEMNDTYMPFYSEPKNSRFSLADIWFNGVNIKRENSLSIDWAGGGIISTLKDLSIFVRALNNSKIISDETLNTMYLFNNKFETGIYYGLGFMEYHFKDYFPTLSFLPNYRGHMGVLGTQMFYDKKSDTVYISSFGSTDYSAGSVKTMIKALSYLYRVK